VLLGHDLVSTSAGAKYTPLIGMIAQLCPEGKRWYLCTVTAATMVNNFAFEEGGKMKLD